MEEPRSDAAAAGGAYFCKQKRSAMPARGVAFLLNTRKEQERGGVAITVFYYKVYPKWER
jgi:hypothetical protein